MRIITLEEHISLPQFDHRITKKARMARGWPDPDADASPTKRVQHQLEEVGEERLSSMDKNGITVQVLSVTAPGGDILEPADAIAYARDYNNAIANIVAPHPDRFAAFAILPMTAPDAAAKELERAVSELGFCGAMINGTTHDKFLDVTQFAPILAQAETLDVPIYLHPNLPIKSVKDAYYSNLPGSLGFTLSIAGLGWHVETAIHILRMVLAGTFDKYPNLKVIIGHMGEMLPMMMARIDNIYKDAGLKRAVSEVLKSQVYITTSGLFTQPPFQVALDTFGVDRILYQIQVGGTILEEGKV
jgi:predicted TIM-barrel fold metal-dependent hydrolase